MQYYISNKVYIKNFLQANQRSTNGFLQRLVSQQVIKDLAVTYICYSIIIYGCIRYLQMESAAQGNNLILYHTDDVIITYDLLHFQCFHLTLAYQQLLSMTHTHTHARTHAHTHHTYTHTHTQHTYTNIHTHMYIWYSSLSCQLCEATFPGACTCMIYSVVLMNNDCMIKQSNMYPLPFNK